MLKKFLIIILSVIIILTLVACGSKESSKADYDSVRDAVLAHKNGEDITGKTVTVTATMDADNLVIYFMPDTKVGANLYVTLLSNDNKDDLQKIENIKEGDTVDVKIGYIDDHLEKSIYLFATLP